MARIVVLVAMFLVVFVGVLFIDPIPQDPAYHRFADNRILFGIPHFGDVVSNVALLIVGFSGMLSVFRSSKVGIFFDDPEQDSFPYSVFFLAVAFVAIGSTYYHITPNTSTLFWDRLPMTVAFMSLFSAVIADRIHRKIGAPYLMAIFLVAGAISLFYWRHSELIGQGDLRFYALVQFYPILALPVICWMFPQARYTGNRFLLRVFLWYGAAKVFEYFDGEIFDLLAQTVSGHTLKHLAAAIAIFEVQRMLKYSTRKAPYPASASSPT
jgi:hypothetical protein